MGKTQAAIRPALHISVSLPQLFEGQDTTGVDTGESAEKYADIVAERIEQAYPEYDVSVKATLDHPVCAIIGGTAHGEDIDAIEQAVYDEGEWYVFTS